MFRPVSRTQFMDICLLEQSRPTASNACSIPKWSTLKHNGVMFPLPYRPHNIPVSYRTVAKNGKSSNIDVILDPKNEEIATLFAHYLDHDHMKSNTFRTNFWNDWKVILGKDHVIQDLNKVNFDRIHQYLRSPEKKQIAAEMRKADKERSMAYKTAIVDGKEQDIGNFNAEPPGIFLGRGDNPKLGKIKRRLTPQDFTINLDSSAPIPTTDDHEQWGNIIHDPCVMWLASWKHPVTGNRGHVWLAGNSDMKGESDMHKFDLARELSKHIKDIRATNDKNLSSDNMKLKQVATALYFIDVLSLRVGNEKGKGDTDTVGVCLLRNEHIQIKKPNTIKLDFLGKDSVRYQKQLQVDSKVYSNLIELMANKKADDRLFDQINSADVNRYLQEMMPGLTAKVFRTYNASSLFEKELNKIRKKYPTAPGIDYHSNMDDIIHQFNMANVKVAGLCNHQKNVAAICKVPASIEKMKEKVTESESKLQALIDSNDTDAKIKRAKTSLDKLKQKQSLQKAMKNIALGTSKISYIDPRISAAFMKEYNIPINRIFSKTLQQRFAWSLNDQSANNYKFNIV